MATLGRLARLHVNLLRAVESVFSEHGLQVGEFDVLATLRRVGEPYSMTPTAVARQLMLSPAGMTSRLDRLEQRGFVERRPAPDDRRSTSVVLTKEGLAVVDAAVTDHVANEARLRVAPLRHRTANARRAASQAPRPVRAGRPRSELSPPLPRYTVFSNL